MTPAMRERAHRQSLFAVLRWVDAKNQDKPLLGRSLRAREDAVRLAHQPDMAFAATEISSIDEHPHAGVPVIRHFAQGLFGPNGPLPLHLTEQAWDKLHNHADTRLRDFADIFHHRMQCLFYRAWAEVQPVVALDRSGDEPFTRRIAALGGYAGPELAGRDALSDHFKVRHAGQFSRPVRSAHELRVLLVQLLGVPVMVAENVRQWLPLDADSCTALGRANSELGQGMVLGKRVPDVQFGFAVQLGPLTQDEYDRFDPASPRLQQLHALIRNWLGTHYNWTVQLQVSTPTARRLELGRGVRLGFDSWLLPRSGQHPVLDGVKYCS
ncbi:type VI secretion system baseplate subunit TssG [Chitinilyticum litopenaei]|uniref:type VI secretion system baseplate subunit TssG n=1 Tax=Chitinilyticum litopenaei TaxID=1121276 RepID=UPI0003FE4229|nr:type VI secretion system baseplate subunit TssG [Chitinilyticum litopenaei]